MSNEPTEPNDDIEPDETDGTYNPSGGTPSHPADPQYGEGETDDETDRDKRRRT